MSRREDDTVINILYNGHPPACSCVECAKKRIHVSQIPRRPIYNPHKRMQRKPMRQGPIIKKYNRKDHKCIIL